MTNIGRYTSRALFLSALLLTLGSCVKSRENGLIKVLILSGRNNHEWQKTTPLLARIYSEAKLFRADVTNSPDTLKLRDLRKYDVIVSNWNTWPDNDLRLSPQWEKDFAKYVMDGGGTIFIHAGASSFYPWEDYHRIGIGRWGKETHHGEQTRGRISGFDINHPVTKGLKDFLIVDEIWEKTEITPGAVQLASVSAVDTKDGHAINEGAVYVSQSGKGKSFYTTLGHNERSMLNSGFRVLLLRATQWVAHRDVTIEPPADINSFRKNSDGKLNWITTDSTLILQKDSGTIWQFNFNNRFGRPYFHPLVANSSVVTCASPPDHPWHLGFWFSWKFINGINYWEYLDDFKSEETGYKSAGITEVKKTSIDRHPDYSADIHLSIDYHPADSASVLSEEQEIHISAPFPDGSYYIDHENSFTALAGEVVLDRTPVQKEPGGRSWGGYAGLSVRFSQDYSSPVIIAPDTAANYKKNSWVYMGFNTLAGDTAGMCIFQNMKFTTDKTSWYVINNPAVPFFYYSPAVLYDGKIIMKKGEKLHLKYRTWILPGQVTFAKLQSKYDAYLKSSE